MLIIVIYRGKKVLAYTVSDYKITISQEDAGCAGRLADPNERIELDQCRECGVWCSEDDEFYGDGYCTECASMCSSCEQYFNYRDLISSLEDDDICIECRKKEIKEKD